MNDFFDKVNRALSDYNMLKRGDSVIVALSGGADSVSLFYTLLALKSEYELRLYAAHVNHNLRGEEALRDENFVRTLCDKEGTELFVKSVDVRSMAERRKISEELCGREVRYGFFDELSKKLNAKIATAHTASDNAETVIFNLTRGSGIKGLCGIAPVRDRIIRPLIYVTREDVERFCREKGLDFVTDNTNLSQDYTRNKIRGSVIPVLKELNPDFENTVSRETSLLREYNSLLELNVDEAIKNASTPNGYDCAKIINLPKPLRRAVLYELCKQFGANTEYKLVLMIDNILCGGAVNLGKGVRAVCKQKTLRFVKDNLCEHFSEIELKSDSEFVFNGKQYSVKELKINDKKLVFRTRRAGDTFELPRRKVTKTIKKLFNELKIPQDLRDSVMLIADGSEILWIEGVGASASAAGKLDICVKNLLDK